MKPFLSVIVPAYNEAENIKSKQIDHLYRYLKEQAFSFELIFVDDGSSDKTLDHLQKFSADKPEVIVIANPHQGKAPTVATGMLAAKGENRLFTDFDQATPIDEVEKLLPFRRKGYDVIIGSREVKGARREKEPFHRHLMGRGFNMLVKLITVGGIQDTQCGFKLFSDDATKDLFPKMKVYGKAQTRKDAFTGAFDVELLYLAHKLGYKIVEVPVAWKHIKTDRVSPIKDSARMLRDIVRIRINDLMGKYQFHKK